MANAAAVQFFQADHMRDILNRPLIDLVHSSSKSLFEDVLQSMMENRPILEATFLGLKEKEIDAEVSIAPFFYLGKPAAHLVIRDISIRKRRERRLAVQFATTRILAEAGTFVEAAPQILRAICENLGWDLGQFWMLDAKANLLRCAEILHISGAAEEFIKISRNTLFRPGIGLPGRVWTSKQPSWIPDVVVDKNFPRAPLAAKEGLHGGFGFPILLGQEFLGVMEFFSHELRRPDTELLEMFASVGSQIGQYVLRKQAEEARNLLFKDLEKANQELKDFAYVVSHDLKAPLRAIGSLASWLASDYADKLDEDGKENLEMLVSRVKRMHSLIEGILQYSRVGRADSTKSSIDLNQLVAETIESLAPPQNIRITVETEMPSIWADPVRIQQLFQNLISNAIKYMDKPQGQIQIRCDEENEFWKFSIKDNGPGIEERHFERVFQLFQTLAPRDEVESTGVGLAVVAKIVELYGGKVGVHSIVGEGSTFYFTLAKQIVSPPEETGVHA